jgi:hypothetical protein
LLNDFFDDPRREGGSVNDLHSEVTIHREGTHVVI